MEKNINIEVKRELKPFEKEYLNSIYCKDTDILKIYNTEKSNWNLMLKNSEVPYFVCIPKVENSCSACIYGSIEHAKQYNIFIDLI